MQFLTLSLMVIMMVLVSVALISEETQENGAEKIEAHRLGN